MAKTGDPAHYAPAISVKVQKITSRKADWFELAILTVAGTHIPSDVLPMCHVCDIVPFFDPVLFDFSLLNEVYFPPTLASFPFIITKTQ